MAKPVLIVEDDPEVARLEEVSLARAGIPAVLAASLGEACALLGSGRFQAILLDYRLPDGDVWDLVETARALSPGVPVVLVTGVGDEHLAAEALRRGVADYLPKLDRFCDRLAPMVRRAVERSGAALRLVESEQHFRVAFETAVHGMALVMPGGRFFRVNPAFCAMVGYSADELLDPQRSPITHPDDLPATRAEMRAVLSGSAPRGTIEKRYIHRDGRIIWALQGLSPVLGADGTPSHLIVQVIDITEQKLAAQQVADQATRYKSLMSTAMDAIHVLDEHGNLHEANESFLTALGYTAAESAGLHWRDWAPASEVDAGLRMIPEIVETRMRRKDGTEFEVEISRQPVEWGGRIYLYSAARDISHRKAAEARLVQVQKLAAVSHLASGIAHDFNNVLAAIMGFAELLTQDLAPESRQHQFARNIYGSCQRAESMVAQIKGVAGEFRGTRRVVDLVPVVAGAAAMLRERMSGGSALSFDVPAAPLVAEIDPALLGEAVVNLGRNGLEALTGGRGSVLIALDKWTANGVARPASGAGTGRLASGAPVLGVTYARIVVTDTGTGIAPDILQHIFNPFFTTKRRDRGTGIGLTLVNALVTACHGFYEVETRPGVGTTVSIFLPLAAEVAPPPPVLMAPPSEAVRVLVIDDEPLITQMLVRGLGSFGHDVTAVNDPIEALSLIEQDPAAFDAVISDQIMPGMNGSDLLMRIKAIDPQIRLILHSGQLDGTTVAAASSAGIDAVAAKPAGLRKLADLIAAGRKR
jgi:PAS domain S-box-containing protein